ncbi:MAG: hypothetical protein ACRC7N_17585 [Clostridium sp.]
MFCKKCGGEIGEGIKFCANCGSPVVQEEKDDNIDVSKNEEEVVKEEGLVASVQQQDNKIIKSVEGNSEEKKRGFLQLLMKNKKIIIGLAVLIVVGVGCFFMFSGGGVPKDKIKQDFVGKTISIGSMKMKLSEENIKSVEIEEDKKAEDLGFEAHSLKGIITIENDKIKIKAPFTASYIYNDGKVMGEKGWELGGNNINTYKSEDVTIDFSEKLSEEKIKSILVGQKIQGLEISEDLAKNSKIVSNVEGEYGLSSTVTIDLGYKGKLVDKTMDAKCSFQFNGEDWEIKSSTRKSGKTMIKQPSEELSLDDIKKELSVIAPNGGLAIYASSTGYNMEVSTLTEFKDLKIELQEVGYSKKPGYLITGTVKGNDKNVTYEGKFSGSILESDGTSTFSIKDGTTTLKEPKAEDISKTIVGKNVYFKKDTAKSSKLKDNENDFKMDSVLIGVQNPLAFYAFGTLSYGDVKDDKVTIIGAYDNKKGVYQVVEVRSATLDGYAEEYSIEVIKKAIEDKVK